MLMSENKKRSRNADDLRKKHEKVLEKKWKKRSKNHKSCSDNKKSRVIFGSIYFFYPFDVSILVIEVETTT